VNSIELALRSTYNVLGAGLVFGAGLPVLYAVALRALTIGSTTVVDEDGTVRYRRSLVGRALATLLVLVVVAGVALGLLLIISAGFGKTVSFEHVFPAVVDKK
jgi:hypothetical protein